MGSREQDGLKKSIDLDELDLKILDRVLIGGKAKAIASETRSPLSTVQRRIRRLFESGVISNRLELNYDKLGLKKGEIFVYLKNVDARRIAEQLADMEGIRSVSIHIGNSDIVGQFMYRDSAHLLELTSRVRQIEGVDRVVWSEEIYRVDLKAAPSLTHSLSLARAKQSR